MGTLGFKECLTTVKGKKKTGTRLKPGKILQE